MCQLGVVQPEMGVNLHFMDDTLSDHEGLGDTRVGRTRRGNMNVHWLCTGSGDEQLWANVLRRFMEIVQKRYQKVCPSVIQRTLK